MPAVTRIGDADVAHCSGMTRAVGSSDVFANGIAVSRQSDINTIHKNPPAPCQPHTAPITLPRGVKLYPIYTLSNKVVGPSAFPITINHQARMS